MASRKTVSAGQIQPHREGRQALAQVLVVQLGHVHVEHVQERLGRQQLELAQGGQIDAGGRGSGPQRGALVQELLGPGRGVGGLGARGILGELGLLGQPGQRLVQRLQVGQDQLGDDRLDVAFRRHVAVHVGDVRVGEHAHHLADRVGLADVGEELVAQALALRGAADQAGDVGEPHRGRHDPRRVVQLGQLGQARVGDADHADVRLDGGERVVGRQRARPGQRVEQGGLADVGQADDADRQAHPRESSGATRGQNRGPYRAGVDAASTTSGRERVDRSRGRTCPPTGRGG